jgi:ribosomal protein S19E (S16A)
VTAHQTTSITCDYGGRGTYTCSTPEYFAGSQETAREARATLRSIGWVQRDGLDLCPEHAQTRESR